MSGDTSSLEPPRGLSPLGTNLLIGGLAFLGGIGGTALMLQLTGAGSHPAPAPSPVVQTPQTVPSPVPLPPGTDLVSLSAREQALAARLDQLEAKLAGTEASAQTASGFAGQAERLMIAFAVRRSIERGLPLGPLEARLRQRFGATHGEAVATIIQAARTPVTLEDLRAALEAIAPRLNNAPGDSLWMLIRRGIGDLVVVRQAASPSPRPADRMKRARRTLDEGQVEAALAEVAHMPGVANGASWVTAAKQYIAARTALHDIEAAAMETPAAPAPARPAN